MQLWPLPCTFLLCSSVVLQPPARVCRSHRSYCWVLHLPGETPSTWAGSDPTLHTPHFPLPYPGCLDISLREASQQLSRSPPMLRMPYFLVLPQTWLRVLGGLHSPAQVVVGALIGLVDAYTWKASFDMFQLAIARGSLSVHTFNLLLSASFA